MCVRIKFTVEILVRVFGYDLLPVLGDSIIERQISNKSDFIDFSLIHYRPSYA
jgi:hypothetical protein